MYALCVGVRDHFFSLSYFTEDAEEHSKVLQDFEKEWTGSYRLDPSWDERVNGQGNNSLVWCHDGAQVLTEKHFQYGFFAFTVRESKDSEIHVWKPALGHRYVFVTAFEEGTRGLRMVRTFGSLSQVERSYLYRQKAKPYGLDHLYWWFDTVSQAGDESRFHALTQPLLDLRKTNDPYNH